MTRHTFYIIRETNRINIIENIYQLAVISETSGGEESHIGTNSNTDTAPSIH